MSYWEADDHYQIYYETYGDPGKQPVMLVHGLGGTAENFRKQISDLSRDYYVVAYDQRGHGRSERRNQNLTISQMGKDINGLMEYLGLEKTILTGWSMGVNAVMSYINDFGDSRLDKVVLIDNTPKMIPDEQWKYGVYPDAMAALKDVAAMASIGWPAYSRACIPAFIGQGGSMPEDELKWYEENYPDNDTLAMVTIFASNLTTDLSGALSKINVPVMITYGVLPSYGTKELYEGIASYIKDARVCGFNGGHLHFWQDAEQFNRRFREFAETGR